MATLIVLDLAFRTPRLCGAFLALSPSERASLTKSLNKICTDPSIDGQTKLRWPADGPTRVVYEDDEWEIIYRIAESQPLIEVWSFSRIGWERGSE